MPILYLLYFVLQQELGSEQHLPCTTAHSVDWKPQKLWRDSGIGIQFHHRGASATTHGLVAALVRKKIQQT